MQTVNITELDHLAAKELTQAEIHAQLTQCSERLTKNGKPYLDIQLADSTGTVDLKVWQDKPWFDHLQTFPLKSALSLQGDWRKGEFGMETSNLEIRSLNEEETEELFSGGQIPQIQIEAWDYVEKCCSEMNDPRLRSLCLLFLSKFGTRLRRAAAARNYHHARRGGLIEHIYGMMRTANAISGVYTYLNKDLLLTGVLFHDSGKLWETCYGEQDFALPYTEAGELLGHIPLGIELVNKLWMEAMRSPDAVGWTALYPLSAEVRLHVLHMIASHHGELAFGSPVVPKTPEAMALHYVDNLDAKMEMFRATYEKEDMLADNIYRRNPPLPSHIFSPLPSFPPQSENKESAPEFPLNQEN